MLRGEDVILVACVMVENCCSGRCWVLNVLFRHYEGIRGEINSSLAI